MKLFFAVCLFISSSLFGNNFIIQVSSVYKDQHQKYHRIYGTGTITEYNGRYFVKTVAHVSQGSNLDLRYEGKRLKIIRKLADNLQDIEWIEIKKPKPVAVLDSYQNGKFCLKDELSRDMEASELYLASQVLGDGQSLAPNYYLLVPSWAKQESPFVSGEVARSPTKLISTSLVFSGTSGSSVIYDSKSIPCRYQVVGLAQSSSRFFRISSFASSDTISSVFEKLLKNEGSTEVSGYKWNYQNYSGGFFLYRAGNGYSEIYLDEQPMAAEDKSVGGGESSDHGGGESSDHGDDNPNIPVIEDFGVEKQESSDFSWNGYYQVSITKFKHEILFSTNHPLTVDLKDPNWCDPYKKLGIEPEIKVDGKKDSVIGFYSSNSKDIPIFSSLENIALYFGSIESYISIRDGKNLIGYLKNKLGFLDGKFENNEIYLKINNNDLEIYLKQYDVRFVLDETGALPGHEFRPFICVKKPMDIYSYEVNYVIDLRSFLFADPQDLKDVPTLKIQEINSSRPQIEVIKLK